MFLCNLLIFTLKGTKNIPFPQLFQWFSYAELTFIYLNWAFARADTRVCPYGWRFEASLRYMAFRKAKGRTLEAKRPHLTS